MVKQENVKIVTLFFVSLAFVLAFVVRVLFESLAVYFGVIAQAYGQEWLRHGIPIVSGVGMLLYLQLQDKCRVWAHEVVIEVRKMVWPSYKATLGMTVTVCVILLIAGFVLGLFDMSGGAVVNFIINRG